MSGPERPAGPVDTENVPFASADQARVRDWLAVVETVDGLDAALEGLFRWSVASDYFAPGIFESNLVLKFPDTATPVVFRTQINYSRLAYAAPAGPRPGCPICFSEVGSHFKPLLRAHEFLLGKARTPFFAQLTPFPLRARHFIVIEREHNPMRVGAQGLDELLDFVERAPSFTACSNSDVTNAGVSILGHHHYQVFGGSGLPVFDALPADGCEATAGDCSLALLDFPIATLRVAGPRAAVGTVAAAVVAWWKGQAPGMNTANLTVRRVRKGQFEAYLFFRNPAHLTPPDLLRIKSEGVGVVEVSGEGIYPPPDEATLGEIRRDGLVILKRILSGLNPVERGEWPRFFAEIVAAAEVARCGNSG